MTLRSNLSAPHTQAATIAVLVSSGVALIVLALNLAMIPAMAAGSAGGITPVLWALQALTLGAVLVSIIVLSRRTAGHATLHDRSD